MNKKAEKRVGILDQTVLSQPISLTTQVTFVSISSFQEDISTKIRNGILHGYWAFSDLT